MNKLFDMDNKLFRIIARITDLMVLNIVFVITCIPIITIGAASAALNESTDKIVKQEESYLIKDYISSFKKHFVKATKLWMAIVLVTGIFIADFRIMDIMTFSVKSVVVGVIYGLGVIYLCLIPCTFYGECTLKDAFLLAMSHPLKTFLMAFMTYLPIMWFFLFPATISALFCFMTLAGFAVISFLKSHVICGKENSYGRFKNEGEQICSASHNLEE